MLYFFISHLFLDTSFLYVLICLLLIAGCWTKMRLTPRPMKIIFNRCNAIFFYFTPVSRYIFFICAYLFTLNCRLLDKDEDEEGKEEHP